MQTLKLATTLMLGFFLASCGGGGGDGGGGGPTPTPAPTGLTYVAPSAYTVGVAIAALNPSVTGAVSAYSIAPALPAGLQISSTTGVISGTPTAIAATTAYTVTASNAGGSTTAAVSITVNDVPPAVTLSPLQYSFWTGTAISDIAPSTTGGAPTGWTVSPALPAGLAFQASTGVISGTPTAASPQSTYRITAQNSGGSGFVDIQLGVSQTLATTVLLDLGHANGLADLKKSAARLLSTDTEDYVVLWNSQTGTQLYAATLPCSGCQTGIAMAGNTVVARSDAGFTIRSATDGSALASIAFASASSFWWKLASDGSYLSAGNATGLTVWSPAGAVILSRAGNYAAARVFAAPGELRVAAGPAGAQVIEKVALPAGTVTTTPAFQGTFHSWFQDGERFFSATGFNVWVYSKDAVQVDLSAMNNLVGLGGRGNFVWATGSAALRIYAVGDTVNPVSTNNMGASDRLVISGDQLAILRYGEPQLRIVDLSGGTPVSTDYDTPVAYVSAFASSSASDWAFGNVAGVLMGEVPVTGSPQLYASGKVLAMAGNGQRLAVALANGKILYFSATTLAQESSLDFASSGLSLSDDGSVLMAAADTSASQYSPDRSLRIYQLPGGNLLHQRTYDYTSVPLPIASSMSRSGTVVAELFRISFNPNLQTETRESRITDLLGTVLFTDSFTSRTAALALSPDGSLHSISIGDSDVDVATSIRSGATLLGAAPGVGIGWIDDTRLIVNRYEFGRFGTVDYTGVQVINTAGQALSSWSVPEMSKFQPLAGDRIFSAENNRVYDVADGAVLWLTATPHTGEGAVAGDHVVFVSNAHLVHEPL